MRMNEEEIALRIGRSRLGEPTGMGFCPGFTRRALPRYVR